jgi:PTS system ascorbate-specific IIA component
MNNRILIIAHAPLAHALRQCALHVFPDCEHDIRAVDVQPNLSPEETLHTARIMMHEMGPNPILVLSDVFGATPCNVAQKLVDGRHSRLLAGVNLPLLLRAVTYRNEALDSLVEKALAGGIQGVMAVASTAPQNQTRRTPRDQNHHDHQQ